MEERKLRLETAELDQKLKHGRVTYWLSVLGVAGALAGLAFERYKTLDQRRWEQAERQRHAQIARMTEIATEFDRLFGATLAVLTGSSREMTDTLLLKLALDAFEDRIREFNPQEKEVTAHAQELHRLLLAVKPRFDKVTSEGDIWRTAAELQETWQGRAQLTPDFPLLFGTEPSAEWRQVSQLAQSALGRKFTLMASEDSELTARFKVAGAALQEKLYISIRKLDVGDVTSTD